MANFWSKIITCPYFFSVCKPSLCWQSLCVHTVAVFCSVCLFLLRIYLSHLDVCVCVCVGGRVGVWVGVCVCVSASMCVYMLVRVSERAEASTRVCAVQSDT